MNKTEYWTRAEVAALLRSHKLAEKRQAEAVKREADRLECMRMDTSAVATMLAMIDAGEALPKH